MSQEINAIFSKYKKIFVDRIDELKSFMTVSFENFVKSHILENVESVDNSERLKLSGFNTELSAWRNSTTEITLCSCEITKGTQKRYDYIFRFKGEKLDNSSIDENEQEESKIKRSFREFTEEEKELYRQQKEQEKKETEETLENFLETQTIKDVIDIIEKSQEIPDYKPTEISEDTESPEEKDSLRQIHGYSIRNYLLVLSQSRKRQDDKFVGIINSYWNWKKQKVNVLKNPDKSKPYSYKILVPLEKGGVIKGFKLGSVFDISQTNKYEEYLKQTEDLKKEIEWQEEIEYERAIDFAKKKFLTVTITEDFKKGDIRGSYDAESKTITIHENSSHTLFHELGKHITTKEINLDEKVERASKKEEILAEITCYLLMKKFEEDSQYKINS